jgi:sugar phosphate isomerase/epimerase
LCTFEPTNAEAHRARALSEGAGLSIPNLGTYISVGDLNAVEQAMRFAQTAGAPQIRVGVGSLDGRTYAACFASGQDFLAQVERLAARYRIRALVEIHHNTICPSASLAYRLVSSNEPEHVGVIYDPGNMVFEGYEDYRLGFELLGPYLAHVHVKNGAYARAAGTGAWQPGWAPLEDGVVSFSRFFTALVAAGYDGWVSVEDFSAVRPIREALRHNLAFIRQAFDHALQ